MNIKVLNLYGDQIKLSPPIKTALDNLGVEAEKTGADWNDIAGKALIVLQGDGFDVRKLQPEIKYSEDKKGKRLQDIKITYSA